MKNLCHFVIILAGTRIAAFPGGALTFSPILEKGSHPAHPVLVGFETPAPIMRLDLDGDDEVIVPRFAAAVAWAREEGLHPYCVPLGAGRNGEDNSFTTDTLEPAPAELEVAFLEEPLDAQEMAGAPKYHRLVGGKFVIQVEGGPDLPAVAEELTTYRLPDDTVFVPEIDAADNDDEVALIVPQDGKIIDAIAERYPAAALLVTDVVRPGSRTRLFQVR